MIGFTLEGYVLAMIKGVLEQQAATDAPKHPDFYKLKRRFDQQLRIEHPYLNLVGNLMRLADQAMAIFSARSSVAPESRTSEQESATA